MLGGLSVGVGAGAAARRGRALGTRTDILPSSLRVKLDRVSSAAADKLVLNGLSLDRQSVLDQIATPESPQLAATPRPGRVSGSGKTVSGLIKPLEVGSLYLVSYEILADHGTAGLYFPETGGSPFAFSNRAPFTPGRHKILAVAQDGDTAAVLRITGDLTFGYFSCRKAEWHLPLPGGAAHPELAARREPGRVHGDGAVVSGLTAPLEAGTAYTLRYEIKADRGTKGFFTAPQGRSPFDFVQLPRTPGHHAVTLVARDGDTEAVARVNGDLSFGYFSCRRAGGSAGQQIEMDLTLGSSRARGTVYTPDPGALYVAPWGDDARGTGAFGSPLATPAAALAQARPGDTLYLRPGTYAPFEIPVSGTAAAPLTVTTLPGEERQAVIEGDLQQHKVFGGPGVAQSEATRDGIYIRAKDHIHIRNLSFRNLWRCGIFVVGAPGEQHGHHVIAGNLITRTGHSAIFVGGNNSTTLIPRDETVMRTIDVLIEHNDVSQTNVVMDYNNNTDNNQGEPGGVSEAISVSSSSGNVITRFNDVHDTRQYGIDYKAGVRGGAIYGNRVWNVERYGIYLDSGRRFVEDVAIHGNHVWACNLGIVLAREAASTTVEYAIYTAQEGVADFVQRLERIDVYNNLVWDTELSGIYCQRHPKKDGPHGAIRDIRIRFNTVYNANRFGTGRDLNISGWADTDFAAAGVAGNIDFIGNIVWNDTAEVRILDTFTGKPGFTVADNLIGVDPGFADTAATPPDLSLAAGSAAAGLVGAGVITAPFDRDYADSLRVGSAAAGAFVPGV